MEVVMSKKIGWQKYEDMIKKQISSPLASLMMSANLNLNMEEDEEEYQEELEQALETQEILAVPVPESFHEQISLVTNYDCWIGHTNFDITPSLKKDFEEVEGVEVLKVCSRYRFFVGVAQMFDFKDVRKLIEEIIN
jgi:hypothetical protein|tara:strand:+ start:213 stop:623 length:411 start_codon:yes stop_codon:yes gene_type:complete